MIFQNPRAQPFIEAAKNGSWGYTISTILDVYSAWLHNVNVKKLLPPHDVIPLLTGVKSDSMTTGIAYLKGACWKENKNAGKLSSMVASVVSDDGTTWRGACTLAHELAHR